MVIWTIQNLADWHYVAIRMQNTQQQKSQRLREIKKKKGWGKKKNRDIKQVSTTAKNVYIRLVFVQNMTISKANTELDNKKEILCTVSYSKHQRLKTDGVTDIQRWPKWSQFKMKIITYNSV